MINKPKAFTIVEVLVVIAILGILCAITFGGCHLFYASHITEGVVVWKKFVPEHQEEDTTYVSMGEDFPSIPITSYHTVPDKYSIGLQGEYEGKIYVRHVYVDRTSYLLIEEGQQLKVSDIPLTPTAERNNE